MRNERKNMNRQKTESIAKLRNISATIEKERNGDESILPMAR